MVLAAKILRPLNWYHLPCMAHKLNLVVQDAKDNDHALKEIVDRTKKTVAFFHHSTKAMEKLSDVQQSMGIEQHALINDVPTRWNSTLDMLERMGEQHKAVNAVLAVMSKTELSVTEADVVVMKEAIVTLKPFKLLTSILSAEQFTTLSTVIPYINGLHSKLDTDIEGDRATLRANLKANMRQRFGKMEEERHLAIATLLDPRYKKTPFLKQDVVQGHRKIIQNEVANILRTDANNDEEKVAGTQHDEPSTSTSSDLQELLGFMNQSKKTDSPIDYTVAAIVECDTFFRTPTLATKEDPAKFWKENETNFPSLSKLSRKYTFGPATSVPCERLFSTAGDLVSSKRSRLSPENVNKILFLNKNM